MVWVRIVMIELVLLLLRLHSLWVVMVIGSGCSNNIDIAVGVFRWSSTSQIFLFLLFLWWLLDDRQHYRNRGFRFPALFLHLVKDSMRQDMVWVFFDFVELLFLGLLLLEILWNLVAVSFPALLFLLLLLNDTGIAWVRSTMLRRMRRRMTIAFPLGIEVLVGHLWW